MKELGLSLFFFSLLFYLSCGESKPKGSCLSDGDCVGMYVCLDKTCQLPRQEKLKEARNIDTREQLGVTDAKAELLKEEQQETSEKQPVDEKKRVFCPVTCSKDSDCEQTACGNRRFCVSTSSQGDIKECIEKQTTSCPTLCFSDRDCFTTGCQQNLICNTKNNRCVQSQQELCPSACNRNSDCETKECGLHAVCVQGTCQRKSACSNQCNQDNDCKTCHADAKCLKLGNKGSCVYQPAKTCPSRCSSNFDCLASGCGGRKYCNTNTGKCYDPNQTKTCPSSCQSDDDCAFSACGAKISCFKNHGAKIGSCREKSLYCPATCVERHPNHNPCFAQGCSKDSYCSDETNTCKPASQICPMTCNSDKDCNIADCGPRKKCHPHAPKSSAGTCAEETATSCPAWCLNSSQCAAKGCGDRDYCVKNTCVSLANYCPDTCSNNQDCQTKGCGKKTLCALPTPSPSSTHWRYGKCIERKQETCPSQCKTNEDCHTTGCGLKTFCNYLTHVCEEEEKTCKFCKTNADCAQNCGDAKYCIRGKCTETCVETCTSDNHCKFCGSNTRCLDTGQGYKSCYSPTKSGQCPTLCSNDHQCNTSGCGVKKYCNTQTKKCVEKAELCSRKLVCKTNADCANCGEYTTCVYGYCSKEAKLPPGTCPTRCRSDFDCKKQGCGKRWRCNTFSFTCVTKEEMCNKPCSNDTDCDKSACGSGTTCGKYKHCISACPQKCSSDADCSSPNCGKDVYCARQSYGTGNCTAKIEGRCPSSCTKDADCGVTGCGEKVHCNLHSNTCAKSSQSCPLTCKTDSDCSANKCGAYSVCKAGVCALACPTSCAQDKDCSTCSSGKTCFMKTIVSTRGVCKAPSKGVCPTTCNRREDCFVDGCGTKNYCNALTNTCTNKADLCPLSCRSNSDCPQSKCGSYTMCLHGACAK